MAGDQPQDLPNLGELEAQVMREVWRLGEAQVRDVHEALSHGHRLAYTTVMTVMTRLVEKGLLERERRGRAYVYRPAVSEAQVARPLLRSLVEHLLAGSVVPAVSYLLEGQRLSPTEVSRLRRLVERLESQESERLGSQGGDEP